MPKIQVIEIAKRDFYAHKTLFKHFKDIKDEDIENIKEMGKQIQKEYLEPRKDSFSSKRVDYINTLSYLNSLYNKGKISFDLKVFLLIIITDPHLITYQEYTNSLLITKEIIENEENEMIKDILRRKRKKQLTEIETRLTQILGFVDRNLLYYETIYLNRIVNKGKINKEAKKDLSNKILEKAKAIKSLDAISEERWNELKEIAKKVEKELESSQTPAIVSNALLYQNELLRLQSLTEQILLYLLLLDPEFYLLTIYEEESNFNEIKRRALQELKFYNKDLISIEKMIKEKFYPEKKDSSWALANRKEA